MPFLSSSINFSLLQDWDYGFMTDNADTLPIESLFVRVTLWEILLLILKIFTEFFLFKYSLLFQDFPLQVRFILYNIAKSRQELKAFSTKYFLQVFNTPDKFNQKCTFKFFLQQVPDRLFFFHGRLVYVLHFSLLIVFSLSFFFCLKYKRPEFVLSQISQKDRNV